MKHSNIAALALVLICTPKYTQTKQLEIPLAWGDFFDRFTVLKIKRERIDNSEKLYNINKEYELLSKIHDKTFSHFSELDECITKLKKTNETLWELEDCVREKEYLKEFDTEFRTIVHNIIENNDLRFAIKRSINILLGSSICEEKSYRKLSDKEKLRTHLHTKQMRCVPLASMPISIGDLLDRISILEIKLQVISEPTKRKNVQREYRQLKALYKENVIQTEAANKLYEQLLATNKCMWDIQDLLRDKIENKEFDETFVKLGRSVYYTNDKRITIKHKINMNSNSSLVDEKEYSKY